jgi:ribosomal protein S18 acetylase RimI-like enzyme
MSLHVRSYTNTDEPSVIALWHEASITRPWNDPRADIARKLRVQPELFLIGELEGRVVATAMGGYDGHRGSVYYLAVSPREQRRGFARILMSELESRLLALGRPKLNLVVRTDNLEALALYEKLGYGRDAVVSLGKRMIRDEP